MKAMTALYRATAREFLRDRMAILFTILLPLVMAAFFGTIFNNQPPTPGANGALIPGRVLYVPGMLALGFLWLGVFGTAPAVVQQREQKVFRRIAVTPLSPVTVMTAQVAWRLTTVLIQATIMLVFGAAAYGLRIAGNPLLLVGAILLGGSVLIALGLLLAGLARSNESVVALGQVVQFPMMFLSGILFPITMLPQSLRVVTRLMPLTYIGDALRQTMLGAVPLFPLWLDFAVMAGCLVVFAALATRLFKWE